jgi:LPXTG-motif cell wall-anchored protein
MFAAIGAALAAAGGFLIGRRRPKKIVFEETRKK